MLVTHGYGVQVLSEYMRPAQLVTSTDFACLTVARAVRRVGGGGGGGVAGRVPVEFEHSGLVPEPLDSGEWEFECEQVCDARHWRMDKEDEKKEQEVERKLANPLPPEPEATKVRDK